MEFKEAHLHLMNGEAICRASWMDKKHVKIIDSKTVTLRQFVKYYHFEPDQLNSDRWIVVDKDERYLGFYNFGQMAELLSQGLKMRYETWQPSTFIVLSADKRDVFIHTIEQHNFIFGIDDLSAKDWEIYNEQL
jgi:hypothetical protein